MMEERRGTDAKIAVLESRTDGFEKELDLNRTRYHELINGPFAKLSNDGIRRDGRIDNLEVDLAEITEKHEGLKLVVESIDKKVEKVFNRGMGLWFCLLIMFEIIRTYLHK